MKDAFNLLMERLQDSYVSGIYEKYGIDMDEDDTERIIGILKSHLDEIYAEHFSFLEPYKNDPEFFASLDLTDDDVFGKLSYTKLFVGDDFYYNMMEEAKRQRNASDINYIINDINDIDRLSSLGYSLQEISNFEIINPQVSVELYKRDKSLVDVLMDNRNISKGLGYIASQEYLAGNKSILKKYFDDDIKENVLEFVSLLADYNIPAREIYNDIKSSIKGDDNFSYVSDISLIRKIVKNWGPDSILFAKDITKEVVDLVPDFSYDSYIFFDGSIKKSPDLLLSFLNRGYTGALFYCDYHAVDERVIDFIDKNNIPLQDINDSSLVGSYLINQFLFNKGFLRCVFSTEDILTEINSFNYVYDFFKNEYPKYSFDERDFYYSKRGAFSFVKSLVTGENSDRIYDLNVSSEVGNRIIELGLSFDRFIDEFISVEGLAESFYNSGEKRALFVCKYDFIYKHLDEVSYDDFLSLVNNFTFDYSFDTRFLCKFFKEGHYEIFNYYSEKDLRYVSLDELGLDNISYDEYLSLPDNVKKLPDLRKKFLDNPDELIELLKVDSSTEVVYKALLAGVDPKVIFEMNNHFSLDYKTVKLLLEKGYYNAIYHLSRFEKNNDLEALVKLFYEKSGGLLPNGYIETELNKAFLKYYISKGNYEIINRIKYFKWINMDEIVGPEYDYEMFKKYPILDVKIIERIITPDNQVELINLIIGLDYSYSFVNFEQFIGYILKTDINNDFVYKLTQRFNYDIEELLKESSMDVKGLLSLINRSQLYKDKENLDLLFANLNPSQIKSDLTSYFISDQMVNYIIRKMVESGHYDFVSLYSNRVDGDVLKEAILNGYFPPSLKVYNDKYAEVLANLQFTDEEIEILRSRLDKEPFYALLIPDIKSNPELIIQYLIKVPDYLKLLSPEYFQDVRVLNSLVLVDPYTVSLFINDNTPVETLATLIRTNPDLLNHLRSYLVTSEIADLTSAFAPQVIDIAWPISEKAIMNALNKGYVFNSETSLRIVEVAFINNFPIPLEFFKDNISLLIKAACELSSLDDFDPSQFYTLFSKYFNYLLSVDEVEFYYRACKELYYKIDDIKDEYKKVFEDFGLGDLAEFGPYLGEKESFYLIYYIKKNNITEENIEQLESYVDLCSDKVVALRSIDNYYYSLYQREVKGLKELFSKLAFKYLAENPMGLMAYLDSDDPEVISACKGLLEKYPQIYTKVPKVLDNKTVILGLIAKGFDVYSYLSPDFRNDLEIIEKSLELNIDNIDYIDSTNIEVREFLLKKLDKFPKLFVIYPDILVSADIIIKLMSVEKGMVYRYISDEFKRNYDICLAFVKVNVMALYSIPTDMDRYDEIVKTAIKSYPEIFRWDIVKPYITQELYEEISKKLPDAYLSLPPELMTVENYKFVTDQKSLDYSRIPWEIFIAIINSGYINFDDGIFINKIVELLLSYGEKLVEYMSPKVLELLKSNIPNVEDDKQLFKGYLSLGKDFDYYCFGPEYGIAFANAIKICESTGKVNTMEKNPVFSYKVCKYIYPLFGVDFTRDIIKYDTPAAEKLIDEIVNGNSDLVVNYYKFIVDNNIFDNDDKLVHFAFRGFDTIRNLIIDILNHKDEINDLDCENLSKIIKNFNFFDIQSFEQLKNYKSVTKQKIETILKSDDIYAIKSYISLLFGYKFEDLSKTYENFQLDNFALIASIKDKIKQKLSPEEYQKAIEGLLYNKEDLRLILFIKQVIYSDNIDEIRELMKIHIDDGEKDIDYSLDLQNIIDKIRRLYNLQFNLYFTKVEDLKSPRFDRNDPNNKYGVTIIDMDGEEFKFLAHRLWSYDQSHAGYAQMIKDDPSLWFKLEGASTLSTSCITDKGFKFLHYEDPGGVVYLFNSTPEQALLFMHGRDLVVEHGGYRLEPTSNRNMFSDLDGVLQCNHYHHCHYNEVALFRDGMVPCAILCTAKEPTEEQIRAAKFFSEYTGKDIPIIRFDMPAYDYKTREAFEQNREKFKETLDIELVEPIILNGIDNGISDLVNNIQFCFNTYKEAYQRGDINYLDFFLYISRIIRIVNRLDHGVSDVNREITRLTLYRDSLVLLTGMDRETICRLNNAEMGESGLMYRLDDEDKSYLVKPAVEKQTFRRQDFRAEIQAAAAKLQSIISPETAVNVDVIKSSEVAVSKQELIKIDKEKTKNFEDWVRNGGELDENIKNGLLKEYVVDFLLCNFDCFFGNFVIDENGNLRGIDKEQSFRFMSDSRSFEPDFSYTPNGTGRIPIYRILFERYKKGEITLDFSVVTDTIEKARSISDEQYRELFRKYASSLDKYHAEAILDSIVNRRDAALERIEGFIHELSESKGVNL